MRHQCWAMGIIFSPEAMAGRGASMVNTPSCLNQKEQKWSKPNNHRRPTTYKNKKVKVFHLRQRRADQFGIGPLGQQELSIVFSVDGFGFGLFLVFGVHQQLVVHCFDDNLFGRVLGHVETQFQFLLFAVLLNERRVQTGQPIGRGSGQSAKPLIDHFNYYYYLN